MKVKVKSPFPVKRRSIHPELFVTITFSLLKVILAVTLVFVAESGRYEIDQVRSSLSIRVIEIVAVEAFPAKSVKLTEVQVLSSKNLVKVVPVADPDRPSGI